MPLSFPLLSPAHRRRADALCSPRRAPGDGLGRCRTRSAGAVGPTLLIGGLLAFVIGGETRPLLAAAFPPISDFERTLSEVPGQPGSPAVVLFKRAMLRYMNYPQDVFSSLEVAVRIKILSEEGKSQGDVEIPHTAYYRLRDLEGRTVLADGTVLDLPADAIFEERRSRSERSYVTKLVFPGVEVGAILDYRYTVRWDDLYFLEPWHFHSELPTLHSEIEYFKPDNLGLKPWILRRGPREVKSEIKEHRYGRLIRLWAENLHGIPDEPHSYPFADLTSRAMMVPESIILSGIPQTLLRTWDDTCAAFWQTYKQARNRDSKARKRAIALTSGATSTTEKIRRLNAFVRDEVRTIPQNSVGLVEGESSDSLLELGEGTPVAKALLLQAMLGAVKIDSDLLWVADRTLGRADLSIANPWWFDSAIVRVTVDNEPLYFDPSDRSSGFGSLTPNYEGTQALRVARKKAEILELPESPHDRHRQRATVGWRIDGEGQLHGEVTYELFGHKAWQVLRPAVDDESTLEVWQKLLEDQYSRFKVSGLEVTEKVDEQEVRLEWSLTQREEDVLGDEVTIRLSQPIGPTTQLFALPPERRRTPVQMLYDGSDEVAATVRWEEGWQIAQQPSGLSHRTAIGSFTVELTPGESARQLVFHRRFERIGREFPLYEPYRALRDLYAIAALSDSESLVFLRE